MILTGAEIAAEVAAGRIVIDDFEAGRIEPNSYGVRLSDEIVVYHQDVLDCAEAACCRTYRIGPEGLIFEPGGFYLGSTAEAVGSFHYAATLYARRSVSTLGVWIQFSAPLGHSGAILRWTLEMTTAKPTRLFAGMLIGKVAFWRMAGEPVSYDGKYVNSTGTVPSRLNGELAVCRKEWA